MEHDWTKVTYESEDLLENSNRDVFTGPGWMCPKCGIRVIFLPAFSGTGASCAEAGFIVSDPDNGHDLDRARILAATCGASTCEMQIVRFVMLS